jgi:hypothetical protein
MRYERIRNANGQFQFEHGLHETSTYKSWAAMLARCENPKNKSYFRYGGRGIRVCERWQQFVNFLADMGLRPSPQHSIDRYPDNDGDYTSDNCRWATVSEQARNRRSNHLIEFRGEIMPLMRACELSGVKWTTAYERLKRGWSVTRALGG